MLDSSDSLTELLAGVLDEHPSVGAAPEPDSLPPACSPPAPVQIPAADIAAERAPAVPAALASRPRSAALSRRNTSDATAARPWGARSAEKTVALVSLASDPNEEFRPYMEDGHKIADPLLNRGSASRQDRWAFFGVYDGHGGRRETEYCEGKLHDVVLAELRSLASGQDVSSALKAAFAKVDSQLAMLGAWDSGCTVTVALAHLAGSSLTLHVANVGDSRAVLLGPGQAHRLSVDHRASDPAEAARVVREGGVVRRGRVGGRLCVSRSLGDHHLKSAGVSCVPEVCTVDAGEAHALVIASDGLWDVIEDADAGDVIDRCVERAVAQSREPAAVAAYLEENAARDLVAHAKERGSRDNVLCLVIFI